MIGSSSVGYSIALAVIACAILLSVWWWWSRRRLRQLASEIPGPSTIPFLGNALQLSRSSVEAFSFLREQWIKNKNGNFRLWLGPRLYVLINVPEDAEEILIKQRLLNRDSYVMKILSRFAGKGIVTCTEKTWKKQRKVVAPAFHTKVVETYFDVFNRRSRHFVEQLSHSADGTAFDFSCLATPCILDVACDTLIGTSANFQDNDEASVSNILKRMLHLIYERAVRPWLILDFLYDLTAMGKEQREGENFLFSVGGQLITSKMQEYHDMKSSGNAVHGWMTGGYSLLDHIIRSSETQGIPLDDKLLKDELYSHMIAATDTVIASIYYTLTMLALNPQVQERTYQELQEVFSDDWDRSVTPEDVKQMKYLDRVLKETMRLFPTLTFLLREVDKELKLSTCTLPKGCTAVVVNYFVHRDPRYFPDPERFDPDRFLPERSQGRHPCSYLPFGAGPRMCVGFKYAEVEMIIVLATVLKTYRILPANTYASLQQLDAGLVLTPACGYMIKMLPREKTPMPNL